MQYWVDAEDRLAQIDDEWRSFAVENDAPELALDAILGRPIDSFCSDMTTVQIWTHLLARTRAGASVRVEIRCDSPDRRRLLALALSDDGGGRVRVVSTLLSDELRLHVPLLEAHRQRTEAVLVCCSWCKKWRASSGRWVEVEELVTAHQDLLTEGPVPSVSHGICAGCRRKFHGGGDAEQ